MNKPENMNWPAEFVALIERTENSFDKEVMEQVLSDIGDISRDLIDATDFIEEIGLAIAKHEDDEDNTPLIH